MTLDAKKANAMLNLHKIKLLSHEAHSDPEVAKQASRITSLEEQLVVARTRMEEAMKSRAKVEQ